MYVGDPGRQFLDTACMEHVASALASGDADGQLLVIDHLHRARDRGQLGVGGLAFVFVEVDAGDGAVGGAEVCRWPCLARVPLELTRCPETEPARVRS